MTQPQPAHFTPADRPLADVFAAVLTDATAHPIIATINDTTWDSPADDATPVQFSDDDRYELAALLAAVARRFAPVVSALSTDPLPPT